MTVWNRVRFWPRAMFQRSGMERAMDAELRFHVEAYSEDLVRSGVPRSEAMRRARLEFGGIEQAKEQCRDARGVSMIESLTQDLRYGLRMLRKNLGLTIVAVLTIALGIAANVSVFSFVNGLFLRSVQAKNPEQLVRVLAPENDGEGLFSIPEYVYLRDHTRTLEELTAHYSTAPLYISANGETGEVEGAVVSSNYFGMLGLQPQLGRFFTQEEDSVPDRDAVAVLGYEFWQRTYGGNPQVLGRTILINERSFGIIGVMPPSFHGVEIGGMPNQIWIPAKMIRVGYRYCDGFQPSCTILSLTGRLKPGNSIPEAQAELNTLMAQLRTSASGFDERLGVSVTPAVGISGDRRYFLLLTRLLTAIGGLLLLIVCANVGGLFVARGTARGPELTMRQALGAGRGRILRQLLTESLLLSFAGGALGLLISLWTSRMLVGFYSIDDEGYQHLFDIRPDGRVLLYSIAVTITTGVLFGLLPALQASRTGLVQSLKSGGRAVGSSRKRSRMVLVAIQVAFSLALLVGAGLLARSAKQIEVGENMDVRHILGLRLPFNLIHYPAAKADSFKREAVRRLRELPVVEAVSFAKGQGLVWHATARARATLPGNVYAKPGDEPLVAAKQIAPDYFATLRIPFVGGRDFKDTDRPGSPRLAIVNETLARKITSNPFPLDQTVFLDDIPYRIVGVVKDAQLRSAIEGPMPIAYLPYWQDETLVEARMCVRVKGDPAAVLPLVRRTMASIDPEVPITETMPLIDQVRGAYTDARVASAVVGSAAGLGLLLSAMGLYGVVSYEVGQRTKEIGVRMALGADAQDVVQLFLRQGFVLVLVGVGFGGVLAFVTTKLLGAWLFGVRPSDVLSFCVAVGILLAVTLAASYIPARRASRVDPMIALRYE
jgi:predicted permease